MELALIVIPAWQPAGVVGVGGLDTGKILDSRAENNLLWTGKHMS